MIKKIIIFMLVILTGVSVEARSLKSDINSIIKDSKISQSSISISVKNAATGKTVYALNDRILMHPASVQKALTIVPIVDALGADYEFSTELYSRGKNGYLIKLGADPYLTTSDLEKLVEKINPEKVHQIYIDNSIVERKDWGEGWQWDDDLNSHMPRFNSYNLDGNLVKITIMPTDINKQAFIINPQKSSMIFYNSIVTGDKNNVQISRDNISASNTLKLSGVVKNPETHYITNNNLKRYFEKKLTDSLENKKIYLKSSYKVSNKIGSDNYVYGIKHPISSAINDVLLNSNNMVIETMAKLSGGKYFNKQGTDIDGVKLFNSYCEKNGIDNSRIRIVDASGVSKNNLIDTDFISEFLIKNKDNKVYESMATPSKGTLSNRMIPLKDNLRAKTGTLSDISSIAGFITAKSGQKYVFAIIINDPTTQDSQKKNLENYLIRDMYMKL